MTGNAGDIRDWAERTVEEIDELPDASFEAVHLDARVLREQGLSIPRIIANRREHGRRAPLVVFDSSDSEVVV